MNIKHLDSVYAFNTALKEAKEELVIIDCYTKWCRPCKKITPWFEEQVEKYLNVRFFKVDIDVNRLVKTEQHISCVPTFLFFKNERLVERIEGADTNEILAALDKHR